MKAYLLICYVGIEIRPYNKRAINEIRSLIDLSNKVDCGFTLLLKENNIDEILKKFESDSTAFMNDPLGKYEEQDEDKFEETNSYVYADDFVSVYIQFVSSLEFFDALKIYSDYFDNYNCEEEYMIPYKISYIDQIEILQKLQEQQTDVTRMNHIIVAKKVFQISLLKDFALAHRN